MATKSKAKIGFLRRFASDTRGGTFSAQMLRDLFRAPDAGKAERPAKEIKVGGHRIWREGDSWFTSMDRGSAFDSERDATRFVKAAVKRGMNPKGQAIVANPARAGSVRLVNVCGDNWRKTKVSDRALRYRANSPDCRPPGPEICGLCGSKRNVEVHHVNGHEEHGHPENLMWACRTCNTRIGIHFKRAHVGRPTKQFNPDSGASSLGQWVMAVLAVKGEASPMTVSKAVDLIRATPPGRRSEFARQIWRIRRQRGTDSTVPF